MSETTRGSREDADGAPLTGRLAAGFVLVIMALGCLVLWIGAPVGGLWLASKLTSSTGTHLPAALVLSVSGMLVTAYALTWINGLYLRITGGDVAGIGGFSIRRRGPLEGMLVVCLVAAIVSFIFWFFVLAENPTVSVY